MSDKSVVPASDLLDELYACENRGERLGKIPLLTASQLEQLTAFGKAPRGDGYVNSKLARSELVELGLAARWNGWNFITTLGVAVLDTLGLMPKE